MSNERQNQNTENKEDPWDQDPPLDTVEKGN